jgi:catechol 2,3-dioxygenase-like lactoylglutathione lyase family enzyme
MISDLAHSFLFPDSYPLLLPPTSNLPDVLGMHALRHEEFEDGCKASCNGPYDSKWSKTMIGYGPEDKNFVLELTYTYGIKSYEVGNDLGYIKIKSRSAYNLLVERGLGRQLEIRTIEVKSPVENYHFRVVGEDPAPDVGPIASVCLHVTDLKKSLVFWVDTLGFLEIDRGDGEGNNGLNTSSGGDGNSDDGGETFATLSCAATSATLRLVQLRHGEKLRRGTGYGRLALACRTEDLEQLQENVSSAGFVVQTPLVSLDTPGKATVHVVIVADPDGHEVCLVGDEAFRKLSKEDEAAPQLLGEAIAKDSSKEWFEKKAAEKEKGK